MPDKPERSLRQRRKDETRRAILGAAYQLFAERGYEGTSMRELARRARIAPGTIFAHFPDKPSLLVAAFREDMGRVLEQALAELPTTGFVDQLLHFTRRLYAFYARDPAVSRVLFKESMFLPESHGQALDAQMNDFLALVARLAAEAASRGELRPGFDPQSLVLAFGSFYIGALILGLKAPVFDVEAQTALVNSLLREHLSSLLQEHPGSLGDHSGKRPDENPGEL